MNAEKLNKEELIQEIYRLCSSGQKIAEERDRYKKALDEIVNHKSCFISSEYFQLKEIAEKALNGK